MPCGMSVVSNNSCFPPGGSNLAWRILILVLLDDTVSLNTVPLCSNVGKETCKCVLYKPEPSLVSQTVSIPTAMRCPWMCPTCRHRCTQLSAVACQASMSSLAVDPSFHQAVLPHCHSNHLLAITPSSALSKPGATFKISSRFSYE